MDTALLRLGRRLRTVVAALGLAASFLVLAHAPTAHADAPSAPPGARTGEVVALRGTPHLWVGGDDGLLHWAGDTRGLNGHQVDWSSRRDVSLEELRTLPRGGPWLSLRLVERLGNIYFPKWETEAGRPTLLRVQSVPDLELFGIDGGNYGHLVLQTQVWEQQTGFTVDALPIGELPRAIAPSTPPALQPTAPRPAAPPYVPPPPAYTPPPPGAPPPGCNPIDPETYYRYGVAAGLPPCFLVNPAPGPNGVSAGRPAPTSRPSDSDLRVDFQSARVSSSGRVEVEWRACNRTSDWRATGIRAEFEFHEPDRLTTTRSDTDRIPELGPGECRSRSTSFSASRPVGKVNMSNVNWTWESAS